MTGDAAPHRAPDVTIRYASPADAAALAHIAARTFVETYAAHNTAEDMAAYLAATFGEVQQRAELDDAASVTLLAEQRGVLIAYAQLRCGAAPGCVRAACPIEVARFYVDSAWHGRGVAYALMDAVEDVARARGGDVLWLGVWERNTRAIAFYGKRGFVGVGTQSFHLGRDVQWDQVMVRRIAERR